MRRVGLLRILLAALPVAALTLAVPAANRVDAQFLGMPFVLDWILAWVLLTPAFLYAIGRVEGRW